MVRRVLAALLLCVGVARAGTITATNDTLHVDPSRVLAGEAALTRLTLTLTQAGYPMNVTGWRFTNAVTMADYGDAVATVTGQVVAVDTVRFPLTLAAGAYRSTVTAHPVGAPSFVAAVNLLTVTNASAAGGSASVTVTNFVTVTTTNQIGVVVTNINLTTVSVTNVGGGSSGGSVLTVNGQSNDVVLTAADVGALSTSAAPFLVQSPPTNGNYIAQAANGVLTWMPLSGFYGSNLNVQVLADSMGITNTFGTSGTNMQTWTWTGSDTDVVIKCFGAAGGSANSSIPGYGAFSVGVLHVTNGTTLGLAVPYGGAIAQFAYTGSTFTASWPSGGHYATNSTSSRGGGGGAARVYLGTNLIMIAAGGAGAANGAGGSGGYPSGVSSTSGGGTQLAGGAASGSGVAGSFMQGGDATSGVYQSGGGDGYYGGGGCGALGACAAGGGSCFLSSLLKFGYATGYNSSDPQWAPGVGTAAASSIGGNGRIVILTPSPTP